MTRWFCPCCGEWKETESIDIDPGVLLECPDCKTVFGIAYETIIEPEEEEIK